MMEDIRSIAITGMSGRFPNCVNIEELQEALFAGKDLISDTHNRWSYEALGTSARMGMIKDFPYFDANFFGINPKEANMHDPRMRKLLEVTYEAIVDAGLNVAELRGTDVGVFLGMSTNDIQDLGQKGGVLYHSPGLMVNLLNYIFDFRGPSYACNSLCSSGLYTLAQAVYNILAGSCSIAIVAAVQHQFDPTESIQFLKNRVLHIEGYSRCFDASRKGYVKGEAIVAMVLQRASDSKRIYATVAAIDTNSEGFKKEGLGRPSHERQLDMHKRIFKNFGISHLDIGYLECHCTGTVVGDIEEMIAVDEFYTKDRKTPLLIGSIKSNLGHTEIPSGLVSLVKVIIAIRERIIPANIHYHTPDPRMKGIYEGRLKVVDKHTPLPDGLIVVDSFGFGGADSVLIVEPYTKRERVTNSLDYRLVQVSGSTEEAVQYLLENAIIHKKNKDFLSLLDSIYKTPIENHNYRGFAILSNNSHYEIAQCSLKKRPVWYVFPGFGSQWPTMGKDLMKIEVFRNTIRKCANALKPHGIDLEDVIINGNDETFNNVSKTFPAITAISVALTDVLSFLGIKPDGIIGHSLGEVGCAYADGLLTPEEATLLAFARGMAAISSNLVPGAMAAIGLSLEECTKILPEDVYVACENSEESVTVSGRRDAVKKFLTDLSLKGIFNKLINNANYALHCPLLNPAGKAMLDFAKKVVRKSKPRTERWLSTAFLESQWESEEAKTHSAEYHYHNYLNQVQFKQVLKYVPKDAIVVEVAPRGLLQSILKKALTPEITILPLAKPGVDNYDFFLSSLGKIHNSGGIVSLENLYEPVKFPVSIDTPIISNLVKWDHNVQWHMLKYNPEGIFGARTNIDIADEDFEYLEGHSVDGKVILPAAAYIVSVWQTLGKMLGIHFEKLSVTFDNVKTLRAVPLMKNVPVNLVVNIFKPTGEFSVYLDHDDHLLSTGKITAKKIVEEEFSIYFKPLESSPFRISCDEFYDNMVRRGFSYSGIFMGVKECDIDGRFASVKWNNNWVAFLDAITQFILSQETTGHSLPTIYDKILIDPRKHLELVSIDNILTLNYDKLLQSAQCGAVEVKNITVTNVKRRLNETPPTVRKYKFVKDVDDYDEDDSFDYSVNIASQIVIENTTEDLNMKIAEIKSNEATQILKSRIDRVNLKKTSFYQLNSIDQNSDLHYDLLITRESPNDLKKNIYTYARYTRFIFIAGEPIDLKNYEVIYKNVTKSTTYVLLRPSQNMPECYKVIVANNNNYNWVSELKETVEKYQSPRSRIYLINSDPDSGVIGLFNTIRLEQYCPILRVFLIRNLDQVERFSLKSKFYLEQVRKDLTVNVHQNGSWGTLRLIPRETTLPRPLSEAYLLKDKDGVKWVEKFPTKDEKRVSVRFASICDYDYLTITEKSGNYRDEEFLGFEYSGIISNGEEVMGIVPNGALATSLVPHPQLTWKVGNKLSLQEAATIPLAYTLTYYGLFIQAGLTPRKSILVHNSSSRPGLAAVALATNMGCTVYRVATGDISKSQGNNIIFHSKTSPFYRILLEKTRGRGVDIVFNCGSEELLELSTNCISKGGQFVEINNRNVDFARIDEMMRKNCSFHNVDLSDILGEKEEVLSAISEDIGRLIEKGATIPLSSSVFGTDEIEDAINLYGELNSTRKVLIKLGNNKVLAYPRTCFNPEKSYIIVGGLGGFGFEFARWMMNRGATKIVLNSRSKVSSGYHMSLLQKWNKEGLTVLTDTSDTSTVDGAETLINLTCAIAPVGGIFNAALHAEDKMMFEQTPENFVGVAKSKIFAAQNLDLVSRKMCKDLDYFVMFSSIASSIGSPTQTNYSFVNSAVERLCESRRAQGFPALTQEWGPLADVGILMRLKTKVQYLETQRQTLASCLKVIDYSLQQTDPVIVSCVYGDEDDEASREKTVPELVAELFGIKDESQIEGSRNLLDLGMDSLAAYELQHLLLKYCGVEYSTNDLKTMNFEDVRKLA